jgi:peroxygenase
VNILINPFYSHRGAASLEWKILYKVGKDKEGLLQRETVRGAFDGSLFERLQDIKKSS